MSVSPALEELAASAVIVDVLPDGTVSQNGTVAGAGDAVMYKFTTQARGTLYLEMEALAGGIDPFLQLYTESLRRIRYNNDRARGDQDSRIAIRVADDRTLYVLASGNLGTSGDFQLSFTSNAIDEYANQAAEAAAVRLRTSGSGKVKGRIHYGGDEDYVSFVATQTGLARIEMTFPGRSNALAGTLAAYNDLGELLGYAETLTDGTVNLDFAVTEAQTYYLRTAGQNDTMGLYYLYASSILVQEFVEADVVSIPGESSQTVTGSLLSGGSDAYTFTATANGYVYLDMVAADGSSIDSYLEVYNYDQRRVARNNTAYRGTTDSRVKLRVKAGQTYYVRASAADETDGAYELTFDSRPYDDYGNDTDAAAALRLKSDGSTWAKGSIHYTGDTDCLEYVALDSGLVRIQMVAYTSGDLSASMAVYNASGEMVTGQVSAVEGMVEMSFSAIAGQTYYLEASGQAGSTGRYLTRVLPTVLQEFIDAEEVALPAFTTQSASGNLGADGNDMYSFTAAADGYVYLDMVAGEGSEVDSYLEVFTPNQRRIARNDNASRYTTDSRIRLRVKAGETYYVRASAANETEGAYELTFASRPYDDYGNTADEAAALRVRSNGSTWVKGKVHCIDDVDYFAYTALDSGLVRVELTPYARYGELSSDLTVYDADGQAVASAQAGLDEALDLSFTAVQSQTYYLAVSDQQDNTGSYRLDVLPMILQEFIDAEEVSVPIYGEQLVSGTLDACTSTMYKFTPTADGYVYLDMAAGDGSEIDSYLQVYNSDQRRIASNNNAARGTTDSAIKLGVKAGETYYVRASAVGESGGAYELELTVRPYDDAGNDIDHAAYLRMDSDGSRNANASINYTEDVDVLKIVAPVTGQMSVSVAAYGSSSTVSPTVQVSDAEGDTLGTDDDGDASCALVFDAVAGQTYYLTFASLDDGTGQYAFEITTTAEPEPDPEPDPDPDPEPDPDPDPDPEPDPDPDPEVAPGRFVLGWTVEEAGVTRLIVAGTNGNDIITLSVSGMITTLTTGIGAMDFTGVFDNISIYGFAGNDVIRADYSITGSVLVYAGDGDDTVYDNSQGSASIWGGSGNDTIISLGGGVDIIRGGDGTDSYWVDTGDSLADVTSAEYAAKAVHQITQFYQPYSPLPTSPDYVPTSIAGQNFRDPTPTSYGRAWANFADRPLFADGPEYDDIRQGSVGDCYFLACLASMADTDPNVIRQMVTSLGDGTYAVRFYRNNQEVYLRLDADLPVSSGTSLSYAKLSPDGETWVAILEKAYAHFRYDQDSYASISGGWMSTVYREMTNESTSTLWAGGSEASVVGFMVNALNAGHAVTVGSYSSSPSPIVGSHAYMVKSVDTSSGEAIVTVYNPWGVDGRSYDSNYSDGLLRLTMTQFQSCFSAIVISAA